MSDLMAVNSNKANSIGILSFDGLTVVDLAGPLEALTAARMGANPAAFRKSGLLPSYSNGKPSSSEKKAVRRVTESPSKLSKRRSLS
jgi:hypothetical protein